MPVEHQAVEVMRCLRDSVEVIVRLCYKVKGATTPSRPIPTRCISITLGNSANFQELQITVYPSHSRH